VLRQVALELAQVAVREHPEQVHVPAVGLDHAEVGQAVVEAVDAAGGGPGDAVAVDRVQGLHAQVELGLGVDRLDRAFDLVAVEGHLHVDALGERACSPGCRRAPDEAGAEAVRALGLQLLVAAGGDRDLRVGLLVAGRHAERAAVASSDGSRNGSVHGSSSCASKRLAEPNSSPIDGARKPSAKVVRSTSSSTTCQRRPTLPVNSPPKVE
jgi:hypothetical protein